MHGRDAHANLFKTLIFLQSPGASGEKEMKNAWKIFLGHDASANACVDVRMFKLSTGLCRDIIEPARFKLNCRAVGGRMGE